MILKQGVTFSLQPAAPGCQGYCEGFRFRKFLRVKIFLGFKIFYGWKISELNTFRVKPDPS